MFWDKYKLPILGGVTLLVVALVASELYQGSRRNAAAAAAAKLDAAKSASEYQKVIRHVPGQRGGGQRHVAAGPRTDGRQGLCRGCEDLAGEFIDKYPQNPLAPSALLGQGSAFEADGKYDEARAAYQRAATSYQKSYLAPLAQLAEGNLLVAQRKTDDARRVYENVVAAYPKTPAASQAQEELSGLKSLATRGGKRPDTRGRCGGLPVAGTPAVLPAATPAADFGARRASGYLRAGRDTAGGARRFGPGSVVGSGAVNHSRAFAGTRG